MHSDEPVVVPGRRQYKTRKAMRLYCQESNKKTNCKRHEAWCWDHSHTLSHWQCCIPTQNNQGIKYYVTACVLAEVTANVAFICITSWIKKNLNTRITNLSAFSCWLIRAWLFNKWTGICHIWSTYWHYYKTMNYNVWPESLLRYINSIIEPCAQSDTH